MEERTAGRRAWRLVSVAAGLALAVGACSQPGTSSSPSSATATQPPSSPAGSGPVASGPAGSPTGAGLEEICAAGAEEGALVHWHNHSDEYVKVIEAFNEKYPDIEVEDLVLSPDEAAQRILTEHSAGRPPTPDLAAGGLDVFKPLIDEGVLVTDMDWASLGVPADVIDQGVVRIHRIALGLGYNTDKLTPDQLPTTWEELIDPKWAGKVIVDPRGRPFDSISLADGWGPEKTLDYVRRFKETVQPQVVEGGTAGLVAVAGGSADITTGGRSAETLEQQAEGAPIDIHYLDVVSTIDNYNTVLAEAAHPNAARCYVAWFATEGQAIYNEVEFKTNEKLPAAAPEGAQVVVIDSPEDAQAVKDLGKEIGRIWTGG
jgi:iron(III) transport system substrate-binding protein